MNSRRLLIAAALGSCVLAGAPRTNALPNPNEPIDPAKRAPISTANAVQPSAMPVQGNGVVGGRIIRMSEIPIKRAALADERAAIDVKETREKKVTQPVAREMPVKKTGRTQRPADLPASIPRVDPERYRKMIAAYQRGAVPADALLNSEVTLGNRRVSLGDINRYANPRAALEAQGIPVTPAASETPPEPSTAPVPVRQEKNR